MNTINIWTKYGFTKYKTHDSFFSNWTYHIINNEQKRITQTEEEDHRYEMVGDGKGYGVFDFVKGEWVVPPCYSYIVLRRLGENNFAAIVSLFEYGSPKVSEVEPGITELHYDTLFGVFHNGELILPIYNTGYDFVNNYLITGGNSIYNFKGEKLCGDVCLASLLVDVVDGYDRKKNLVCDIYGGEYEEEYKYPKIRSLWTLLFNRKNEFAICQKDNLISDFIFTNVKLLRTVGDYEYILLLTNKNNYGIFSLNSGWILEPIYNSISILSNKYFLVDNSKIYNTEGQCVYKTEQLKYIILTSKNGNCHVFRSLEGYVYFHIEDGTCTKVNTTEKERQYYEMIEQLSDKDINYQLQNRNVYQLCKFTTKNMFDKTAEYESDENRE